MEINRKNYRIGTWARPFIEELLRGGYIHNPCCYLEGKARKAFKGKANKEGGWYGGYCISFSKSLLCLEKARYKIVEIPSHRPGMNSIYVLKKFFKKFLKERLIEQEGKCKLYRIEDRNLFIYDNPKEFTIHHTKYNLAKVKSIIEEERLREVEKTLDNMDESLFPPFVFSKPPILIKCRL